MEIDLNELRDMAGLCSGWPTLHVYAPQEMIIHRALKLVESALGQLPQAELIEPWDLAGDEQEEPFELRIDLPDLSASSWEGLRAQLEAIGVEIELVPGMSPGARYCDDTGLMVTDEVIFGDVVARRHFDGEKEEELVLKVMRQFPEEPDAELLRLERDLADAVRSVKSELFFRTDRGMDTVQPVVHRGTGRVGVQVDFVDDLDSQQEILAVVADLICRRADDETVRLSPDLLFSTRLGLQLTLWFISPPAEVYVMDEVIAAGSSPCTKALSSLLGDVAGLGWGLELQVVPEETGLHRQVVTKLGELARDSSVELYGSAPRWLSTQ
ncbi:MAG: hypothetical protein HN348_08640, partial [Proteobacteria bacterium]|nr:hypothetical protein [Pseudomonadota bacterium]